MGGFVHDRIPFTTYYPAIVIATLLGGFWLGMAASLLSAVVAWWMFMPPAFSFEFDAAQLASLITFILFCLLLVGTVTALNSAIDLLLARSRAPAKDTTRAGTVARRGRDFGRCHRCQGPKRHHHELEQRC
jgi:K+-sensing histidine kinase KdpD